MAGNKWPGGQHNVALHVKVFDPCYWPAISEVLANTGLFVSRWYGAHSLPCVVTDVVGR